MKRGLFICLCAAPFVAVILGATRGLRISGVYQPVGILVFIAIGASAWFFGLNRILSERQDCQRLAASGGLLLTPFALVALLWVGLATPWDATPPENLMRYLVLTTSSAAVTMGFTLLYFAVVDGGERFYSVVGFSLNILAGPAYFIWNCFQAGIRLVQVQEGQVPDTLAEMNKVLDMQLFTASVMTYLATTFYILSLRKLRWLGSSVSLAGVFVNILAVAFLFLRGLPFPSPATLNTPWYTTPGFIVGIPAVPWIMPYLIGVILLRHAGNDSPDGSKNNYG